MRKILFTLLIMFCVTQGIMAQPATYSVPVSLGRNNCAGSGGKDSVYYFNYTSPNLTNSTTPAGCQPLLKVNYAPLSGYSTSNKPFTIFNSSIAFNPGDQMLYYVWTDYNVAAPYKSYIWRWSPTTCYTTSPGLDTIRTFKTDIGGITFDADGIGWQLEFDGAVPHTGRLRTVNFTTGVIGVSDTLDLTGGKKLWTVGSGDITITPSGQMYFVFDNKLFTPDYGSYGAAGNHIKCTYIDTIKAPSGATALPGLAFGNGDLIASYNSGCVYRKIDPVAGDTAAISYTYGAAKGVYSTDMTQINSGVGSSKKLISVTATGTAGQYDVVYDIYTRNYGNVPLTSVQVADNLASINGLGNVSNVTATLTSNPAGVALAGTYNGTTVTTLLAANQNLPCFPVANNNFTIRISCRLSNIVSGTVYNNNAVATAKGFSNVALRDSSTNGSNPDLNQNDKPDDVGENQPTPFVIILTPTTPPCSILAQTLYNQDFGTGTGLVASVAANGYSASSAYAGVTTAPVGLNRFTVTNNAINGDASNWINLTDHTGNANGRMLLVNADAPASIMYRDTMPVACPGQQYSVSLWAAFIGNSTYQTVCDGLGGFKYPKLLMRIRDLTTGLTITQFTTNDITLTSWQQLGMKWVMPAGYTNVILEILNAGPGGCGNDVALDDIVFGICDPVPTVSVTAGTGCLGTSVTFTSALSDPTVVPGTKVYQWQVASALAGPYTNIVGATSATYTIASIAAADTGKYYRVIVAATGNILITSCQYISPGVKLNGKAPSVAATGATANKNSICPGIVVTLTANGGFLGTNASWKWYSGSCGGTLVGTGASITVTPLVTTTYYVRAEGDCNTTTCQSVTITISCNIDKDKDGIPDWVESNFPAAFLDVNSNGILDAYDAALPGYVDNNNDFINDNFQADGDSDGDGILNYLDTDFPGRIDTNGDGIDDRFDADLDGKINMLDLDSDNDGIPDVVEAYGVDANGDGLIDNYTDTDGDGLSQNVDANNTGAYNSGAGLGRIDFDNDNVPNEFDLDSDNDGIPDILEAGGVDANNNGKVDVATDANANGWADVYEGAGALLKTGADGNGDGRADSYPNQNMDKDARPNPYDVDSDGDGIVDVIEAGLPDANIDGVVDGTIAANGWSTSVSGMAAPLAIRKTDADAKPDYLDIDSDNDGITDNIEGQTTNGYLLPGTVDSDGDGLVDTYDNVVGFGGGGIHPVDTDGDAIPDYRDLNSDGDTQSDVIEGNDFNFNRLPDDLVTLTNVDTDGDGLDDRFDSDNTAANVTSAYMGNSGSFTGSATPGTRSVVQMSWVGQSNRDWRYVGTVLPVEFVNFSGLLQNNSVPLTWKIVAQKDVARFEIERSIDNSTYIKTGTVTGNVILNTEQTFTFTDDVSAINTEVIYYRLKVIGKAGEIKYSNILVIRRSQTKTPVNIMPNPANNYVSVRFFAEKESEVSLRLIDNIGKTVLLEKQKVMKGLNMLQINNLRKYSNGIYTLQITVNDEVVNQKLVIAK